MIAQIERRGIVNSPNRNRKGMENYRRSVWRRMCTNRLAACLGREQGVDEIIFLLYSLKEAKLHRIVLSHGCGAVEQTDIAA